MALRNTRTDKKWLTCLRCGRRMYTDVYHRLCRRCKLRNQEVSHRVGRVPREFVSLLRHGGFDDIF